MRRWIALPIFWIALSPLGAVLGAEPEGGTLDPAPGQPFAALCWQCADGCEFGVSGLVRGYYLNDQRIRWSGLEASFGAEGVLRPWLRYQPNDFEFFARGELFINQRYGSTMLSDPERDLYRTNFEIDTLEVFQLFVGLAYEDLEVRIGRQCSPFGRYESPQFSNARLDAPFIRTEIIGFTETGAFVSWHPGWLRFDAGVMNGESARDTNSSKGGIGRVGVELDRLSAGVSVKVQDGIGSEYHKRRNTFAGCDLCCRVLPWCSLYGEWIWDRHGMYRETNLLANPYHFGRRTLYGRDVYDGGPPVEGHGFHAGIRCEHELGLIDVNWGSYFPEPVGVATHDEEVHRLLTKLVIRLAPHAELFGIGIVENRRPRVGVLDGYRPWAVLVGSQFDF